MVFEQSKLRSRSPCLKFEANIKERSPKMFKTRITKWGLNKNMKEPEARAILQMYAQRRDRPTKMRPRGQEIDVNRIKTYFKRKGISIEDVLSSKPVLPPSDFESVSDMDLDDGALLPMTSMESGNVVAPESMIVRETPAETSTLLSNPRCTSFGIPARIEAPGKLKTVEDLFADIGEYTVGFVQSVIGFTHQCSIIY